MRNAVCFRWFGLLMAAFVLSAPMLAQKGAPSPKDQYEKPRPTLIVEPVNVGPRNPALYVPYNGGDFSPASGDQVVVDVTGTPSYDSAGAACNIRMTIPAPAGRDNFNGIGWEVQLTAFGASWRCEIALLITNVNGQGYILRPGAADCSAGTGFYTSNGVGKLRDVYGLPDLPLPDGNLYLEFYETYNDFPDCGQDGNWDSGSVTFQFGTTPPFTGWDETINGGGDAGDLPETAQSTGCAGDVNHDGMVDDADLLAVLFAFGQTGSCLPEDIDGNGGVDDADLLIVLFNFGCTGESTLTAIRGELEADGVDVYAIYIEDPNLFSASLCGDALFDTQLFLFRCDGTGVVHNDDSCGLLSQIDNSTGCITAAGVYYLAVSRYNRDPVGCDGGLIWNNTPFGAIRCPDGPEAGSRVNGWTGGTAAGGTYIITLQGAKSAAAGNPNDCPPPPLDRWDETLNGGGDAGDLPATAQKVSRPEATPCVTAVTRISGNRATTTDPDMYVICITDPANFSATTVGGAEFDTQLFLFRCDGTGVVHNDDCGSLQSCIDNSTGCLNNIPPGIYLLAISGYNQDPVDSFDQPIWANTPFGEIRCPDGPGALNPIAGWTGAGGSGAYIIQLQGAYFVSPAGCN